jgi:hypothetical protein
MNSVANLPVRSEHPRRPLLWLIVAFVAAFALTAGILIEHDRGTESGVERRAASTGLVPTPVAPTACWNQYGFLLATMATTMNPEAVDRIVPALSEETRTGIRDAAEVMGFTNCISPTPDRDTLTWALGRLTPRERAAIMAELPPAIREAVANGALEA